jgi:regulator of RNase E activity RraA
LPIGPLKLAPGLKGSGQVGVELTLGQARVKPGDWAFGDADGVVFIAAADLASTRQWAERSWQREEALAAEIRSGKALGDLLGVEAFLEKRGQDPNADFNEHLAQLGRAI